MTPKSGNPLGHNREIVSKRSMFLFFLIGAIMLVSPLVLVIMKVYAYGMGFFPYVMIAGGLIIGYNMKRISDSLRYDDDDDENNSGEPVPEDGPLE